MTIHAYIVTVRRQGNDWTYKQECELTFPEYQVFMQTGELPIRFGNDEAMPWMEFNSEQTMTGPIIQKPGRPAKDAPV